MIVIRKATPADIPVLIDLQQKLAFESEGVVLQEQTVQRGMEAMFQDPTKGFYNVAEEDGDIAGCHMITYEWSDWRNGMVWWLQSVYVVEKYRQRGVFRLMYENILRTIKDSPELVGLRLYVDKSNARAMKVYGSMGMNGDHYTLYEWIK